MGATPDTATLEPAARGRPLLGVGGLALFAAGYALAVLLGRWAAPGLDRVPTWWPAAGVYVAVLLACEFRHWPQLVAAAFATDAALKFLVFGYPAHVSLAVTGANSLEALTGAYLVRRWCGTPFRLDGLREVMALVLLAGTVSPGLCAIAIDLALSGVSPAPAAGIWQTWWIGDAMGVVTVAPLVLLLLSERPLWRDLGGLRRIEGVALLLALALLSHTVFSGRFPYWVFVFPALLLVTLRFGLRAVALALPILAILAVQNATSEFGISERASFPPATRALMALSALGAVSVMTLALAAQTSAYQRTQSELRRARDELEQRVAERTAALSASEERWRLAAGAAGFGSYDVRLNSRTVCSPELLAMLGLPADREIENEEFEGIVHPDDREACRLAFLRSLDPTGSGQLEFEARAVMPDGEIRWMRNSGRSYFEGEGLGRRAVRAVGIVQDVTAQRMATEALRASEERLRAFMTNSAVVAWMKDAEGRYVFMSENYQRRSGLAFEDLAGKTDFDLWPREMAEGYRANDRAVLAAGHAIEFIEHGRNPDGSPSVWLNSKFPHRNAAGEIFVGALGVDINERVQAEAALREADRRKDEFIAQLAHELRNPLAPISNGLQILSLARGDAEVVETVRAMMRRQVDHLVRLVDDLLDVSRITLGRISLRVARVELAPLIRNAVETQQPLIDASRHQLALALPPEPLWLEADPVRLVQVFSNLLHNAARYTPEGGQIWLTARREGEHAVVRIRDTGVGISAELLAQVFELFAQASPDQRGSQEGLGIGLTLVRSVVELHGGRIAAASDGEGKGSEFTLWLPLLEGPESA